MISKIMFIYKQDRNTEHSLENGKISYKHMFLVSLLQSESEINCVGK